jgi:hypothetical protein
VIMVGAMFRTESAALISAIANHPDVRPTLEAGDHYLEGERFLRETGNIAYASDKGIILFTPLWHNGYRGHIGFLNSGRGATALNAAKWVLNDMFTNLDASAVVAGVPLPLRRARMFCRMLGFKHTVTDAEQEWMLYTGGNRGRLN